MNMVQRLKIKEILIISIVYFYERPTLLENIYFN